MTDFLLQLFGVQVESAERVAGAALALRHSGALGWILLLALVLGALTWWSYWRDAREMISARRRRVLVTLRIVLFALLLLLLLRPVLAFTVEGSIRRMLVTLLDASASIRIQDPRFEEADLKRVAIAQGDLEARKGLDQSLDPAKAAGLKSVPRLDVLKSALRNADLNLFERFQKEFDLSAFTFGREVAELSTAPGAAAPETKPPAHAFAWLDKLEPNSQVTALGDAVRELLARKRGQPLAGIFLATDGANNTGSAPLEAARLARQEGVPLYIYGVGITSPRDFIVGNLFTQEVAFQKDELPVTVRVRGQGMRGQTASIVLRLGAEIVATKELRFENDDEQVVALPFTPQKTGEFELRASIEPREDEAVKDNNAVGQRLKVIDSKIKVLYVESAPRWEFRYLQSALLRDRRLELKCVLLEGDPVIAQGERTPYLAKIPETKEELFKFDLLIIGDVAAKDFTPGQSEALGEFVSKFGGSLLFLAGPRSNPHTFKGSVLEKMLPVELGDPAKQPPSSDRATTLELTAQGRTSPMLRLSAKEDENAMIWRRFGKLYWVARVGRAKPAAQVLLHDTDPVKATRFGKMPVVAVQQYGLGQVLFVGTDNTWRWRRNASERFYPILWGQIAQKMGLHHLLGGSKRTQLTADKQSYTTGERVTVYARLYGSDYSPLRTPAADSGYTVQTPEGPGPAQAVTLRAVPEQPGMYRGEFVALAPGIHQFSVKSDPQTVLEFNVHEPRFEFGETAMNEVLLRQMAEISGGAFFREETLHQLPEMIRAQTEHVQSTVDAE
ncbi:MAG: hypothetical protein M3463_21480, partial [Verrucomicrobiota bacterium]|nr:hypothetical protein [Verrucomicrobiota bacterium]